VDTPARKAPPVRLSPPARRSSAWRLLPLAAVLGLVLGGGWWGSQPATSWTVTDVVARKGVNIAVGCGNPGEQVFAGVLAVADSSEFELQLGQALRMRLLGGTSLRLPDPPGRWFGRERTLELTSGEIFGTTAGEPLGFRLRIVTGEAEAVLTGTTFAVFRTSESTCFCLWNGSLAITSGDGKTVEIEPGQRVFVYRDGRPSTPEPLPDWERMKLSMMDDGGLMDPLPVHP
jgi:ferric-dicitrate binding protein FerR (iron transport regulator)